VPAQQRLQQQQQQQQDGSVPLQHQGLQRQGPAQPKQGRTRVVDFLLPPRAPAQGIASQARAHAPHFATGQLDCAVQPHTTAAQASGAPATGEGPRPCAGPASTAPRPSGHTPLPRRRGGVYRLPARWRHHGHRRRVRTGGAVAGARRGAQR
jgi:hypothetical protein